MTKEILLTGDRPTGKLHIGHYIGSLKNRVKLQNEGKYEPYIMIADTQALTDNARDPEKIKNSLRKDKEFYSVTFESKLMSQIDDLRSNQWHHEWKLEDVSKKLDSIDKKLDEILKRL